MLYSLEVKLKTDADRNAISNGLEGLCTARKGQIIPSDDETILVQLGSRLHTRLLGVWLASQFKRPQLPLLLRVTIEPEENANLLTLRFDDSLGFGRWDAYSNVYYWRYFMALAKEIATSLHADTVSAIPDDALPVTINANKDQVSEQNSWEAENPPRVKGLWKDRDWVLLGLFSCPAFGILALRYAFQAKVATDAGDFAMANNKSRKAQAWSLVAFLTGIILGFLYY